MELKAGVLSGDSAEESIFRLPRVIGRVRFLAAGGRRSLFLAGCQLWAFFSSWRFLASLCHRLSHRPFYNLTAYLFKAGTVVPRVESPSGSESLTPLLLPGGEACFSMARVIS